MSDSSERQYFPKANYCSLIDNAYDAKSRDVGKVKETVETPPEYEYVIELGCNAEVCQNLKLPYLFLLGRTDQEKGISKFKVVDRGDTTLLVAEVQYKESKKLHVVTQGKSISISMDGVTVESKDTLKAREAFIPVYAGVEAGYRLGLPTQGYYYHFMDHKLLHEYKICETGNMWAYNITESTADKLSDELVSNQVFTTLLLPWRVNEQVCKTQHLFHSATKLSEETFKKIDAAWLDTHASKVDLDAILSAQKEGKLQPFEPQPEEEIHVVRQGETLSGIAEAYNLTMAQLLEMNPEYNIGDRKDKIFPGDEVIVSLEEGEDPSRQQKRRQYYTVETGDTLSGIAQKHALSVAELKDLNPFYKYGDREHKIYPGDKFIIQEMLVTANTVHTVKAKDNEYGRETWGDIAELYGFSAKALCEMNASYIGNESSLSVGNKLKLSFPELIKDLQKRNTLPAKPVREVNLTDNMIYRFRGSLLRYQLAPLSTFALLSKSAILNVKSLVDAPQQTYKLCLARYALDEVAPDTRTLEEKAEVGFEEKVLAGLNPLNQNLIEKYHIKPSRFEGQTAHTLTLRQIREGYVYVYYESFGLGMDADYPHASMLFEYKKSGEYFERDGAQTPYLPGHFLIGKAYIVFSERQWTERQRSMFSDDPDFRHQATKISGGVYDFMRLLGKPPSEQTVFDDLPQLIADMDVGDANQDDRFASTIMPTKRHVDEKGNPQPFMPVVSNDVLINTIDEESPQFADILALEDPIAMVEDSLVVTGRYLSEWIDWQEENQDIYNITKAVTGFCNLQLKDNDPLHQELLKDPIKQAKALSIISSYTAGFHTPLGDKHDQIVASRTTASVINRELKEIGVKNELNNLFLYKSQMINKFKWRSRVNINEANEYQIKCVTEESFLKSKLFYNSDKILLLLNTVGPNPDVVFIDIYDYDQSSIYFERMSYWISILSPSLSNKSKKDFDGQLKLKKPLRNLIGTAAFSGVPEFKGFLDLINNAIFNNNPNEAFNQLVSHSESEESLSNWLDKAMEIKFQSGYADQSAHVAALGTISDIFDSDDLSQFSFYKKWVREPFQNIRNNIVSSSVDVTSEAIFHRVPNWVANYTLNEIIDSWKNKIQFNLESLTVFSVSNHMSNYGVNISAENMRKFISDSLDISENFEKISKINSQFKQSKSKFERLKLGLERAFLERSTKRLANGLAQYIQFSDAEKQLLAERRIWGPMKELGENFISERAPMLMTTTIIILNALALNQDYNRILKGPFTKESDMYTLMYRPMWLADSVLRLFEGHYKSVSRGVINTTEIIDVEIRSGNLINLICKSKGAGEEFLARSLYKLLYFGLAAEISLIIAGTLETYQIYNYDFEMAKGKLRTAHLMKMVGTGSMTLSGILGGFSLIFEVTAAGVISAFAIVFGVIGALIYSGATAYLNFVQEDDVSEWLKKTCWGNKDYWDGAQVWQKNPDGFKATLKALSVIKNRPILYHFPTITPNKSVEEKNVDGICYMLEFPKDLGSKKIRIDFMLYNDKNKIEKEYEDYYFFHLDKLGLEPNEFRVWQGEWIKGFRPLPSNSFTQSNAVDVIPTNAANETVFNINFENWIETDGTQLLKFWIPRIWQPTGVPMYRSCPAILLVWYEYNLDLKTGKPKDDASPHCFSLDLSIESNYFSENSIFDSFKTVQVTTERENFPAYDKILELSKAIEKPGLLDVGY